MNKPANLLLAALLLCSHRTLAAPPMPADAGTVSSSSVRFCPEKRAVGDVMPFYWKGEYHVFYLLNNLGNADIDWEHAVSKDLVQGLLLMKPVPEVVNVISESAMAVSSLSLESGTTVTKEVPQDYLRPAQLNDQPFFLAGRRTPPRPTAWHDEVGGCIAAMDPLASPRDSSRRCRD